VSESSGSDSFAPFFNPRRGGAGNGLASTNDSPQQSFASELTSDLRSHPTPGGGTPPGEQKFVGTPDYLSPETILGLSGDDSAVDWVRPTTFYSNLLYRVLLPQQERVTNLLLPFCSVGSWRHHVRIPIWCAAVSR
jgi:serine/threonine protein kinase